MSLIEQFQITLRDYQEHGQDISEALAAPSEVSGTADEQVISNPLRYDLDRAVHGLTQTNGTGAVASALSLSALVFLPLVGFALGLFVGTHDTRSGSIAFRWPQSGHGGFASAKPLALLITMLAVSIGIVVLSALASLVVSPILGGRTDDLLETFMIAGPSISRTFAILLLAVMNGSAFANLGLLIGVSTRTRTMPLTVFALLYFLVPILGVADLRNLAALAGGETYYFVGEFRPHAVGLEEPHVGIVAMIALMVSSAALSAPIWRWRARLPIH